MQQEKKSRNATNPTPNPEFLKRIHSQRFYKAIHSFFDQAQISHYQESSNKSIEVLLTFKENEGKNSTLDFSSDDLYFAIKAINEQTLFLQTLKETWDNYVKFTNPKIETI